MDDPGALGALLPLLVYVQLHLDEDLSLETLSERTKHSRFGLQRAFKAAIGETPRQHVERLRLERAAFHLIVRKASILDIALDCGFESHEVFTRAFKRRFGCAPKDYRQSERSTSAAKLAAAKRKTGLEDKLETGALSSTRVHEMAKITVAFIRHLGPYEDVPIALWDRLFALLKRRKLPIDAPILGVAHDSPAHTPPARLRFDVCVVVPPGTVGERDIGVRELEEATVAVTTYIGPFTGLGLAYRAVFQRLMARADLEIIGLPITERYRKTDLVFGGTMQQTEICVPVR